MTQDEKRLLLVDLSARLPYGVILKCCNLVGEKLYIIDSNGLVNNDYDLEEVKPCLFPLSSMTGEQLLELASISFENSIDSSIKTLDWCYRNHYDVNNLIPMGLANDATGLNIY